MAYFWVSLRPGSGGSQGLDPGVVARGWGVSHGPCLGVSEGTLWEVSGACVRV